MNRDYKVRVSRPVDQATSENMAAWIDELLDQGGKLAPDPGAGSEIIKVSLDSKKVIALANAKRERVPVMLRRILATKAGLEPAPKDDRTIGQALSDALPEKILPRKLQFADRDMLTVVRGLDRGMASLYRRAYGLKEVTRADTPEEDRELAGAMAECLNRRAPRWLVENVDLAKLSFAGINWGLAQTDQLDAQIAERRKRGEVPAVPQPPKAARPAPQPGTPEGRPEAPGADAGDTAVAEELAVALSILGPTQQEGEF